MCVLGVKITVNSNWQYFILTIYAYLCHNLLYLYDFVQCVRKDAVHLDLWEAAKSSVYRDVPRTLNELKTAITAFIRNISQADLQEVFAK
jgi:hypothetical protein